MQTGLRVGLLPGMHRGLADCALKSFQDGGIVNKMYSIHASSTHGAKYGNRVFLGNCSRGVPGQ